MKPILAGLLLLVVLLAGAAWIFRPQIGERLFARAVETAVSRDIIGDLPDGINVALCGSGSPLPDPTRAGPCSAVIIDGKIFIVDIGGGAVRNLGLMGLNPGATEALLLTHFHSDHIDGMGELMLQRWAGGGRDAPLPVIAPEGVEVIVDGLNAAYAADVQYRIAHHGKATMSLTGAGGKAKPFSIPEAQQMMVVYEKDGIKITAFSVAHKPISPAVGYRFDYKGRSVVFSGDTVKLPIVAKACNGCDLLVHEVLNAEMVGTVEAAFEKAGRKRMVKIMSDIPDYHTTPVEAAETAKAAKAKMLVFSHIVPALPLAYLDGYFMKGVDVAYDGPTVLGKDGMLFSLPANKDSIEQGDLL
ncbi:ribonuclease Z [Sphingorhabdus sp. M41]|nr:ribonuclease Z [Sphingorhabdus sp. M41]